MCTVYQMSDPCQVSELNELERSQLTQCQIWELRHLYGEYYLIMLASDNTKKLSAEGNFEEMEAEVVLTTETATWHNWLQWKIVPNIQGGYRIVSKADYNSQSMTVLYGSNQSGAAIVMAPYTNATSQRWTFESIDHTACRGTTVGNHAVYWSLLTGNYCCVLCSKTFTNPAEEDYDNHYMTLQDLSVILALQQTALHENLEDNEAFVQACYRIIDLIRSSYEDQYAYELSDALGNYLSPGKYTYTADTVKTRVEITVHTQTEFSYIVNDIVWRVGETLPAPFNIISYAVLDYMEDYEWCTLTDLYYFAKRANAENKILDSIIGANKELKLAVTLATLAHTVYQAASTEPMYEQYSVQIKLQNEQGTHIYSGIYRTPQQYDGEIHIIKESHYVNETQSLDYEANELDCRYYWGNSYVLLPFSEIFDE